jgi:hypothetical protein
VRLRNQRDVLTRCHELAGEVRAALPLLPAGGSDPDVVDAVWGAEALGTLLWALRLAPMRAYDDTFDPASLLEVQLDEAHLRGAGEIDRAREEARLWHWRARTALVQDDPAVELPAPWTSFAELVAATATQGHARGLLPAPLRGDFPAFGTAYRQLASELQAEALSIALERHHALNWLSGLGDSWDDVPVDT